MSFTLAGLDTARRQLATLPNHIMTQAGQALYAEGKEILEASQETVPVVTGNLQSTGIVSQPYKDGDTIAVDIAYGGQKAPYAVYVHERRSGRGYKFLEKPFRAAVKGMLNRISRRIHV